MPAIVWLHLATVSLALALTPAILWRQRGTRRHRQLGYVWVTALAVTALDTLLIRRNGHFSLIHVRSARTANHRRHRRSVARWSSARC